MYILYFIGGFFLCAVFVIVLFYIAACKRRKTDILPTVIEEKIVRVWNRCPRLLINMESVFQQYNEMMTQRMQEDKAKQIRIENNRQFENKHFRGINPPEGQNVTIEGFILWTFLTKSYPCERSLLMEEALQNVCNKIALRLKPEELDIIWQLDRELYSRAFDHLLEHEISIVQGMEEINNILKRSKNSTEEENKSSAQE